MMNLSDQIGKAWKFALLLIAVTAVFTAAAAHAAGKELVVYTALENEQISKYLATFKEENPDIDVKIVRDSTGIITAKLLAEGARTPADVVWGTATYRALRSQGAGPCRKDAEGHGESARVGRHRRLGVRDRREYRGG